MSNDRVHEQQNEEARKKGCGIWLALAIAAFLLLAVPAVCYLFFSMRAARLVEAEFAEIRAAGLPATPDELDDYYEYPHVDEDATQLWLAATRPLDGEEYKAACGELPIVGYSDEEKIIPPPGEEWEDLEAVEAFLDKYADSLELFHQAAEKGGAARYPIEFHPVWDTDLFSISQLRVGARVLSLQAHVRAHRGGAHGAAESIHAIFMMGNSLEKGPSFAPQLIRMAIDGIACELLRELLPYVEFSGEDMASLRTDIQDIDYDAAFERSIIGARAWDVSAFLNPAPMADDMEQPIACRMGARNDDLLLYLRFMNDYLAAARKPWPQRFTEMKALDDEFEDFPAGRSPITTFRYAMTIWMASSFEGVATCFARHEMTIRATDAALAVEQFSPENGRLPEKLDELVPEFLEKVPLDPFDGKPLRYVVREDAYVIYSVGADRVDDGGRILEEEDEYGNYAENPDMIFPVKRVQR